MAKLPDTVTRIIEEHEKELRSIVSPQGIGDLSAEMARLRAGIESMMGPFLGAAVESMSEPSRIAESMQAFMAQMKKVTAPIGDSLLVKRKLFDDIVGGYLEPMQRTQIDIAKRIVGFSGPLASFQKAISWLSDDPEFILLMALAGSSDKEAWQAGIARLLDKMEADNGLVIGEPPLLVLRREEMTYEEVLALEVVAPRYLAENDVNLQSWFCDEGRQHMVRIIRDAKSSASYHNAQEIKRQGSRIRYREMSLDEVPEPSEDVLQNIVVDRVDTERFLSELAVIAKRLGWRKDRIDNTLKVAEHAVFNGTLRGAGDFLGMDRHTVYARKADIKILMGLRKEEGEIRG